MLPLLLGALLLAPLYWLGVPVRFRRDVLALGSLVALGIYDVRLPPVLLGLSLLLFAAIRRSAASAIPRRRILLVSGLLGLLALFTWNKLAGPGVGLLPSQGGLVLVGVSYLVLKAAAVLIEASRGSLGNAQLRDLLAWIVFLPTYPSGPIEEFEHFRGQAPTAAAGRVGIGLERILFGLVKTLIFAHYLGVWADPILSAPETQGPGVLLLGLYAFTLRFYFDFAGYSDIAIGLAAVFGYEIQENFDNPLVRRNLVQLWQRWHMTLTRWLRRYLFLPVSRTIMRRGGERMDTLALIAAQLATMTVCGLWHGLGWNFVIWGVLQGLGLVWVGIVARALGRRLPTPLVSWWRGSRLGHALSVALTFNAFAVSTIFVVSEVDHALAYLGRLFAL